MASHIIPPTQMSNQDEKMIELPTGVSTKDIVAVVGEEYVTPQNYKGEDMRPSPTQHIKTTTSIVYTGDEYDMVWLPTIDDYGYEGQMFIAKFREVKQ